MEALREEEECMEARNERSAGDGQIHRDGQVHRFVDFTFDLGRETHARGRDMLPPEADEVGSRQVFMMSRLRKRVERGTEAVRA